MDGGGRNFKKLTTGKNHKISSKEKTDNSDPRSMGKKAHATLL